MANELPTLAGLRSDPDRLLTQADLCAILGKSPPWTERHRWARTGVPFIKIGRTPYYIARDVIAYIESRRVDTQQAA